MGKKSLINQSPSKQTLYQQALSASYDMLDTTTLLFIVFDLFVVFEKIFFLLFLTLLHPLVQEEHNGEQQSY